MDRKIELIKDYNNEAIVVKKSQDCSNILLNNRLDRRDGTDTPGGFGRKIASVDIDILDAWRLHEGIDYRKIHDDPEMKKRFYAKLNSRDWSQLNTYDGNI
jgi:hypothetical protein